MASYEDKLLLFLSKALKPNVPYTFDIKWLICTK